MDNQILNSTTFTDDSAIQCREFFNDRWTLYQKILQHNYMGHREIYAIVNQILLESTSKSFNLLDLGCGDASFIADSLQNTSINYYCGLDISEVAIAIAEKNMKIINCQQEFIQGDFLSVVPTLVERKSNQFDFIISSFAFHHLDRKQKDNMLGQIKQLLSSRGIFILIDFVSELNETRTVYIQRYLEAVKYNWQAITPEEMNLVTYHMSESDYPESNLTLELLAAKNNFRKVDSVYSQGQTTQVCCFYS